MEDILKQVHNLLIKNQKTVAVAESCTGGLVSSLLTQIPGSSQYFILGLVAYNNKTKENLLKIPARLMAKKGAVSKEVAKLMARSVRLIAQANLGIGITGIAGPSGGSREKPVGTVFIAIDSKNKKICKKLLFKGSRLVIRNNAALKSLELLKPLI
jgi:nicotinamide-nucleotide amidase